MLGEQLDMQHAGLIADEPPTLCMLHVCNAMDLRGILRHANGI